MSDLQNDFPSWGETGSLPASGYFYEGGDQVNEKHLDGLFHNLNTHFEQTHTAIRDRVREIKGDVILDQGLVVSNGSGTREVSISASSAGAYVDGQRTGSISSTSVTLSTNAGSSTRTDAIWVDTVGQVGKTEDTTTVGDEKMKIAEVDIATDGTISAIRNTGPDRARVFTAEHADAGQVPGGILPGDIWHDLSEQRSKVRQNGGWRTVVTDEDDISITSGDGLRGEYNGDAVGGFSLSLNVEPTDFIGDGVKDDGDSNIAVEPADFVGNGVKDDGNDNVAVEPSDFAGDHLSDDGNDNLAVDDDFIQNTGDTITGHLSFGNSNDIEDLRTLHFADRDGDGNSWYVTEDASNGHFSLSSNGSARLDVEHNGAVRIEDELTEGASL